LVGLTLGATLLWLRGPLWLGAVLTLVALLLLLWGTRGLGTATWFITDRADPARRVAWLALTVIFLMALCLRFYRIDELPFGLWRDEARHGLFALRIAENPEYRPIYIASERVNMPALGLYPFALALHVWGPHFWTMRVVTALAGALTVFPLYGLAYALTARRSLALGAALLLALSSWHITISRFSFPTVFDPLFGLTGLWLILVAFRQVATGHREIGRQELGDERRETGFGSVVPWFYTLGSRFSVLGSWLSVLGSWLSPLALVLAGALLGLAVQTYHTGRVVPMIGLLLAGLLLFFPAGRLRWRGWRALMLTSGSLGLGLLLTLMPLLMFALSQPAAFNERVSDVFLLSEEARKAAAPLSVLDDALRRHLLMFNYQGDANGRHHAPLRPVLDLVSGIGFLAGIVALLRSWRDWRSLFLLAALGLSMAPSALAVDAPHAMRAFGASSFAYLIAALGWAELLRLGYQKAEGRPQPGLRGLALRVMHPGVLASTLAVLTAVLNSWTYFSLMPRNPEVFMGFYPVQSHMGAFVRAVAEAEGAEAAADLYVPQWLPQDPVFAFLTHGLQPQTFIDDQLSQPASSGARFVLSGYFYQDEAQRLARVLGEAPQPVLTGPIFPDRSKPTFVVYPVRQ
jgi:4-amino-4-deoxy-L-arabinose transferase-like glycosyltransferase